MDSATWSSSYGYLPQREALAAMNETDYVLLLNTDPLNVGNKFYEYVGRRQTDPRCGSSRTARHDILLEQMRAGWWAGIDDVEGIRKLLLDAVNRGDSLLQEFRPDTERIAQYERAVLARRYARLLHTIAGRQQGTERTKRAPRSCRTSRNVEDRGRQPLLSKFGRAVAGTVGVPDDSRTQLAGGCPRLLSQLRLSVVSAAAHAAVQGA